MSELVSMSLCEVAAAIRLKRVSSLEVTKACIERAKAVQPTVNCFIALEEEEALRAARAADRAVKRGAKLGVLHGVPLAHKDMFYRAGQVCTGGSKVLRGYRPTATATVVDRLAAAGALWLGRLNMSELAANPTGHNPFFGDCCNPWNAAYITGGSSSGSAASVAARACFGALGSDTGGSVRLPAAANGVVGLKPTYGRVSRHAILPRAWSFDTVGSLTRTVRDCARLIAVIAGADPLDPTASSAPVPNCERLLGRGVRGMKIGVPRKYYDEGITPDVHRAMRESLAVLRSLGARVIELDVPDPRDTIRLANVIGQVESSTVCANWMRERPQDLSLVVRTRSEAGFAIPAVSYLEAVNARPRITAEFVRSVFGSIDALHVPVMTMPVPTRAATMPEGPSDIMTLLAGLTRNTRPFNFLGLPALSVPAGFAENGLPLAFQLIGRPFDEESILRIGDAYQCETDWHAREPEIIPDRGRPARLPRPRWCTG